jgi:recombination protein RecA
MQGKYGTERVTNGPPPVIVPTGSAALDWALRVGGWQLGRVYEVYGIKDSGKTTLAIASMIEHAAMFPDRGVAYINMENTFDPRRATAMGLDCSDAAIAAGRWFPMLPEHSEHVSDMARDLVASGLISVVVVDSIGAMESDKTLAKEAAKAADAVGRNAKIITQMGKALSTLARTKQCTVLLINQPRANIGSMMAGDVSAGPKHMQHATTGKVEMRGLGGEDNVRMLKLPGEPDPLMVSIKSRMKVSRLKNGMPGRVAESYVNRVGTDEYGPPGIDTADEYITLALREKIVTAGGSHYTLPDGHKLNGRIAFARYLRENPDAIKVIREALTFDTPADPLEDD